jgi:tetratricopeptide (TPR) repeat protein
MVFPDLDDEKTTLFRKTAMVLHDLEKALGRFAREMLEVGDERVSKTYLGEVLDLALELSKGRSEEQHFKRLKEMFTLLDIYGIRNAISHPNRNFHHSYWYRIATVAADPAISKLKLNSVTSALRAAELDQIKPPPDEWLSRTMWEIPNNLPAPEQFEHNITRFIGRTREIVDLKKFLPKRGCRLIAIVAPGGLGKTALLLEVLAKDIIHSPEATEWVDRILYFSSKTEKLTAEGIIEMLPAASTIEEIQNAIALALAEQEGVESLTFEQAVQEFGTQRVLLCLDNLETILKDNQQAFKDFYWDLPDAWRVVVTSRIRVEEATSIALEPMAEAHAFHLAREYLAKRGGEKLNEEELKRLVQACDLVPLAIRLAMDSFIAGQSLDKAQNIAKERILEFSYNNLIEVLSPAAQALLECLFVTSPEPISRPLASLYLQRSDEEIAEAFSQLRGTSLVTKVPDQIEESYTLSSSVRELLRLSPIDPGVRRDVQKQRSRMKQQMQAAGEQVTHPLAKFYIPEAAPAPVKFQATEAFKELKKHRNSDQYRLSSALRSIEKMIETYRDQPVLYRAKGLLLLKLMDSSEALRAFKQAWAMEPRDAASGLLLSYELRDQHDYLEAKDVAKALINDDWDDPTKSDVYHASIVLKNYWLPLIWLRETDEVLEETEDWQKVGKDLRGVYGVLRAQAFRESADTLGRTAPRALCSSIEILDSLFKSEGYAPAFVDEGIKLVRSLAKSASGRPEGMKKSPVKRKSDLSDDAKKQFVYFVNVHLKQMCLTHDKYRLDHPEVKRWIQSLSNLSLKDEENPLALEAWKDILETTHISDEDEITPAIGWLSVKIYYRPPSRNAKGPQSLILFARDEESKLQYIVHKKNFTAADKYWNSIKEGDFLEIQPGKQEPEQTAIKVHKARIRRKQL